MDLKLFRCPKCGKEFDGYKELKSHIDRYQRRKERGMQKRRERILKGEV